MIEPFSVIKESIEMLEIWLNHLKQFFKAYYPYEQGTEEYSISLFLLFIGILITGKIFATLLCDSKRGLFSVFIGMIAPLIVGLAGFLAIQIYVVPNLNVEMVGAILQLCAAALGILLGAGIIAPSFWALDSSKAYFAPHLLMARH